VKKSTQSGSSNDKKLKADKKVGLGEGAPCPDSVFSSIFCRNNEI
jgi:hypothetical protein